MLTKFALTDGEREAGHGQTNKEQRWYYSSGLTGTQLVGVELRKDTSFLRDREQETGKDVTRIRKSKVGD